MIPLKFIRENPDVVKSDLKRRNETEKLAWVDKILDLDVKYRKLLQETQQLRHSRNQITLDINALKKEGKDIKVKLKEAKELPGKIKAIEENIAKIQHDIKHYLYRIPNVLHESVPIGKDETGNKVVRKWGEKKKFPFTLRAHGELVQQLGLANFEDAAKVAGNGFYYLLGDLALLEMAIQKYAVDFLVQKGYTLVQPPLMLRQGPYEGVTDLEDFETMMYKIEGDDLYLIATSEHAIAAMLMGRTFAQKDLPMKYVGASPCFRKEIGSHGVDTKGLFRVHHFNKIEQFIFCTEKDSWKFHEELIKNAESLFQKLKLPYQIVNICSGDIGVVASKKYDLEVWMPREGKYREAVSCSNCTMFQGARLNIKYKDGDEKKYVHTLNSTAVATSRVLRAIIENYQQKDGSIKVPSILVGYMNGIKVIGKSKS